MVAKRETSFSTHQFERLWKRALDNERSLLLNLWDVCQKSTASSRSAVAADLLRTCRVDNITTLRTGKEEVWNEIYFQREQRCLANSLSVYYCKSKKDQATFQEHID